MQPFRAAIVAVLTLLFALQVYAANDVQARWGLTSSQYQSEFDKFVKNGYRLNYVSGYANETSKQALYAGIWEKRASSAWQARHGVTLSQYLTIFEQLRSQGYHPTLLHGYPVNGETRFATIWEKSPVDAWEQRVDMSAAGLQGHLDRLTPRGYRLTHLSGYDVNGEARYAATWEKRESVEWFVRVGQTAIERGNEAGHLSALGYKVAHVSGYYVNAEEYFSVIWEKGTIKGQGAYWLDAHRLFPDAFEEKYDLYNGLYGWAPKVINGYSAGECAIKYSALWEKQF
ncbi:hypothetical protein AJ80_02383 [Polytolypa hystricis UAMH7299]|uniref:Uncharacterized protein n=1 Tax=Polytolypa hystricis (strain UAMH7299) TaxID=1447883 RepID=A0A2B7YRW0_POLH7|nr:hypothetical protein AJ80_02383 [Polytolypa hystricis UAMH7299]